MTEYFDSIAKRIANILLTLAVSFALFACADIGERDNPVDPGYKGNASNEAGASVAKGSMTDPRDGQTYKTVTIGTQTWMAENLNYKTSSSYCYEDYAGNCSKYGRLYEWSAAMNACPTGWHLPNDEEWNTLWDAVGGTNTAGSKLKSTSGWYDNGNGTDSFGFAVLPAGYRYNFGYFNDEGNDAYFWSSTEVDSSSAFRWYFSYGRDYVNNYWNNKNYGFSVRCLWDSDEGSGASSSSSQAKPSSSSSSSVILSESEGSSSSSIRYGLLTDSRDGRTYKTVTIGTQTWMAENLNYNTSGSYCYGDNAGNCSMYGRLYEWSAAMKACPSGWHLPSDMEWSTLWNIVGGTSAAGRWLKSTSGWYGGGNGTDSFGFAVLPAGIRDNEGRYSSLDNRTYFWSSNESYSNDAFYWDFYYIYDYVYHYSDNKLAGFSVRCLKDSSDEGSGASSSSSQAKPSSSSSSVILSESEGSSSSSIKYGSLTDTRDGQIYKTVTIGTQTWMAENLNYETGNSWCYGNKASNCDKYGRLYTWSAVMDSAAQFSVNAGTKCGYGKTCTPNSPHRGICPEGWHVPTNEEYSTLYTYIGGSSTAGSLLKSTSGWNDYNGKSGNGTDKYGFSVLPAGSRNGNGDFRSEGDNAGLWFASEDSSVCAWDQDFDYYRGNALRNYDDKVYGRSLRCLKDS